MAYSAKRSGSNDNMSYNQEQMSPEDAKKQKQQAATKDALKVGAKAAGTYFGGAAGGAVASKLANTSVGDKVLNEGAEKLNKIPGVAQKMESLKDSGAIDAADKATDLAASKGGGGAGETATTGAGDATNGLKNNAGDKTPASSDAMEKASSSSGAENNVMDGANNKKEESGSTVSEESASTSENEQEVVFSSAARKIMVISAILIPIMVVLVALIAVITTVTGVTSDFEDVLAAYSATGGDTGGVVYEPSSDDAKEFYDRIDKAKSSMESEGEELDIIKLVAVYHVINRHDSSYDYKYFTTSRLKKIAKQITYDKEETKNNLANNIFAVYFPNNTDEQNMSMAEEVFEYIDNYKSMVGIKDDDEYYSSDDECTGGTGVCTYTIKGFNINGSVHKKSMTISNLQVRLMQCGSPYGTGSYTTPINQPLVPFESYITGVSYAEVGTGYPKAAQQAQMIAARSYGLARPTAMGNALGKKLAKEKGKWILQISSCVADQVFCNVDKGCSYMGGGDGQGGYVVSGTGKGVRSKSALSSDSNTRKYSNEVQGMLLTDKNGYVVSAGYTSTEQNKMKSLANQGLNYKQILLKMYPKATGIYKANCGMDTCTGSTGDFAKWRQWDKRWASTPMGTSGATLGGIGCLATSVSMLIAKSGVPTNNVGSSFNPGTFVKAMNKVGGIDNRGLFVWSKTSSVVPNFKFVATDSVRGKSKAEKLKMAKDLTSKGYYVVAEVKGATATEQHWVAIDKVLDNSMIIMDPGYGKTKLWDNFYRVEKTTTYGYFKVVT